MAVALGVNKPYGRMAGGTETELKFLATKSLGTPDPEGLSPYSYVRARCTSTRRGSTTTTRPPAGRPRGATVTGSASPTASRSPTAWCWSPTFYRETTGSVAARSTWPRGRRELHGDAADGGWSGRSASAFGGDRRQDFPRDGGLQHTLSFRIPGTRRGDPRPDVREGLRRVRNPTLGGGYVAPGVSEGGCCMFPEWFHFCPSVPLAGGGVLAAAVRPGDPASAAHDGDERFLAGLRPVRDGGRGLAYYRVRRSSPR